MSTTFQCQLQSVERLQNLLSRSLTSSNETRHLVKKEKNSYIFAEKCVFKTYLLFAEGGDVLPAGVL